MAKAIIGVRVDTTSYEEIERVVVRWAQSGLSKYICFANVHSLLEARDNAKFRHAIEAADVVAPDGMPLVWALKQLGELQARRVYGPDVMIRVLAACSDAGIPVGFHGSKESTLRSLVARVRERFPEILINYQCSPPFGTLSAEEEEAALDAIAVSESRVLFVGLGCPKQELWMARNVGKLSVVMLGVGAAFDFLAGTKPQAPRWLMTLGLEWVFRLLTEPRRLWWRYAKHNPRFVLFLAQQLLHQQHGRS